MRLYFPIVLFAAAIAWFLFTGLIKGDWKAAMDILKPTLFFGAVWGVIYYLMFS